MEVETRISASTCFPQNITHLIHPGLVCGTCYKVRHVGLQSPKKTLISKLVNFKGPLQINNGIKTGDENHLGSSVFNINYTSKR